MKSLTTIVFIFCALFTFAQDPSFSVESSKETIHLDESLVLTFTLENIEQSSFKRPKMKDFVVLKSVGTSVQNRWINGTHESMASFKYKVGALKPGTYTIKAFSLEVGDETYESNVLTITVLDKYLNEENKEAIENRQHKHETEKFDTGKKKRKVYKI